MRLGALLLPENLFAQLFVRHFTDTYDVSIGLYTAIHISKDIITR